MTDDELKWPGRSLREIGEAGLRTVGFDFVDVKQCHRYLLSELLGARNRPGPYGGSYENRTRLARDIFTAIAAAVPGMMLATRLNVYWTASRSGRRGKAATASRKSLDRPARQRLGHERDRSLRRRSH